VPFYGFCALNGDDPGTQSILNRIKGRFLTYGFSREADYQARILSMGTGGSRFEVSQDGTVLAKVDFGLYGEHNISNALGAFAVSHRLGISCADIQAGLSEFRGVKRRLENLGEAAGIRFYDDYAHHPSEIQASLTALKSAGSGRLVVVFQPHLFSRTRLLYKQFSRVLLNCDKLFVMPVYAARETPAKGVEGSLISEEVRKSGHADVSYLDKPEHAVSVISGSLAPGDTLLTMGAGDVYKIAHAVKQQRNSK
jgi:UDP-N-acetylmuramate--alanine ligase